MKKIFINRTMLFVFAVLSMAVIFTTAPAAVLETDNSIRFDSINPTATGAQQTGEMRKMAFKYSPEGKFILESAAKPDSIHVSEQSRIYNSGGWLGRKLPQTFFFNLSAAVYDGYNGFQMNNSRELVDGEIISIQRTMTKTDAVVYGVNVGIGIINIIDAIDKIGRNGKNTSKPIPTIPTPANDIIRTEEAASKIPEKLRTFGWKSYVSPGANKRTNGFGAYGLLRELSANYYKYKVIADCHVYIFEYLKEKNYSKDFVRGYIQSFFDNEISFYEFTFWTLDYLLYLREHHPGHYKNFIDNKNFKMAFVYFHDNYKKAVEETIPEIIKITAKLSGINISEIERPIWLERARMGDPTEQINLLKNEISQPKYAKIMDALRKDVPAPKIALTNVASIDIPSAVEHPTDKASLDADAIEDEWDDDEWEDDEDEWDDDELEDEQAYDIPNISAKPASGEPIRESVMRGTATAATNGTNMNTGAESSVIGSHLPGVTLTEAVAPFGSTKNNYLSNWASIPNLQTVINADGSISVLDVKNAIVYEYSSNAKFVKAQRFKKELDMVGAFTKDKTGNYYIFYAEKVEEGAFDVKNMALVKYSSSGQKQREYRQEANIGDTSYGGGVKMPFYAGTCQLEISGNMIAVYFARQMFKASDGRNHQASYGFILDINTFQILTKKNALKIPYVSHSFNQFILPVEDGFMFVDHGDGSPRAFAFEKVTRKQGVANKKIRSFTFKSGKLLPALFFGITGVQGDNSTYAEMGGLAKTPNGYIFTGTSERNIAVSEPHNDSRNLFLLTMNENLTSTGKLPVITNPIWITNYTDKNTETAVSPKIVQIDKAKYLLMWEVYNSAKGNVKTYTAIVNDKGEILTPASEITDAQLNGYDALRYNPKTGLAYWATSGDGNTIRLYSFNPSAKPHFDPPKR